MHDPGLLKKLPKQSKKINNVSEECIKEDHFDSTKGSGLFEIMKW